MPPWDLVKSSVVSGNWPKLKWGGVVRLGWSMLFSWTSFGKINAAWEVILDQVIYVHNNHIRPEIILGSHNYCWWWRNAQKHQKVRKTCRTEGDLELLLGSYSSDPLHFQKYPYKWGEGLNSVYAQLHLTHTVRFYTSLKLTQKLIYDQLQLTQKLTFNQSVLSKDWSRISSVSRVLKQGK